MAYGSTVDLVVSLGSAIVSVPDCVDLLYSYAEADIEAAGLEVGVLTCADSDTVPAGMVISQDPVDGTNVAPGSMVDIVVSSGAASALIVDNDFEGSVDSDDLVAVGPCRYWYESLADATHKVKLDSSDVFGNPLKKAYLDGLEGNDGYAYLSQDFDSPQTGTLSITYDIAIDYVGNRSDSYWDSTGFIFVRDDNGGTNGPNSDGNATTGERFVSLGIYDPGGGSSGQNLRLRAEKLILSNLLWYDTWYTITLDIDFANGTYDVTVDDKFDEHSTEVFTANDVGARRADLDSLTALSFFVGGDDTEYGHGQFYVDNVTVSLSSLAAVPDTVNFPLAIAEAQITAAGFLVGDIAYKYSPNVAPGNVIIQSHTAGSALLQGSEIDLVVSEPVVIIDNGDPDTIPDGNWQPSSGPNPYGGQSLFVSDDGTATYTWTFSPAVSGFYNVSMWWTTLSSRSTNIPVDIQYFNDTETVYINQQQNGGQWNSLGSYYYEAGSSYLVILKAVGGGASNCADAVRFTKENILRHKYTVDLPGGDQMMPVMGDIDGDGIQEIVVAAGYYVVAIDGESGEIDWTVSGASYTAVELVDLNNDGTPEILHGMKDSNGPRLRALNGDGTLRWTSAYLSGEEVPLFPIVAYDLDGDGYPTIFFATQDYEPDPYSGNIDDYTGALVKLDHNGNVLDSTWIQKPCWGGMALGDANFDGSFEVYLGDRRYGYHGIPSNGMQAFDAHTLSTLWTRPDIHHSSPLPILADITGDSNLEVMATNITLSGPLVLDSETGGTISDFRDKDLPTHGTPTVCDIDEDGNLEVIYSTSYPENAPKRFVVFDLVTGQIDFEAGFDFWITWPPSVGDVTGDGHLEIIVAAGSQEDSVGDTHNGDYPILVYNKDFKLIDIVELDIKAGQLTPARVFDTDNDGYNEVVVPGFNNKLMVYDTSAFTSNPPPNTWVQKYSNYRQGVPEDVELPLVTPLVSSPAPEIVDHHEFLPLEEEPEDAKGYSGYE